VSSRVTLPQQFKLSPLLVDNADVDFAVADLQKGNSFTVITVKKKACA
jgi:hypothetical protein